MGMGMSTEYDLCACGHYRMQHDKGGCQMCDYLGVVSMHTQCREFRPAALNGGGKAIPQIKAPNSLELANTASLAMSEADLQDAVIEYLQLTGWTVHAERAARTADGWRTPIQGSPGFPDMVIVKGDRLMFVELKSAKGKLSPEQKVWRDVLIAAGQEWDLWRPRHWQSGYIEQILGGDRC
jgi:hypothetical protein